MQFNRYIEIVIKNFDTGEQFSISSDQGFRMDFNYNEFLDQSSSSNTGTIKIYNLSIATFQKIGTRFRTEVEIWCGYKNEKLNTVDRLCIGGLTSKSRVREGADYITTIDFQTAIIEMQIGRKLSASFPPKTSLLKVLSEIGILAGVPEVDFKVDALDEERYGPDIVKRLEEANFTNGISFHGTAKQVFDQVAEMYSLIYKINPKNTKNVVWTLQEKGFNKLGVIKESINIGGSTIIKSNIDRKDMTHYAQVLRIETGLISSPYVETVETSTGYFDALDEENEELIYQKPVEVRKNSKGEVLKDKDGNIKYTKPRKNKKISRVVVNAKALINPAITTNSWVKLENTLNQLDGFYRVRNIKYEGSTHENDKFVMEMTLTYMKG